MLWLTLYKLLCLSVSPFWFFIYIAKFWFSEIFSRGHILALQLDYWALVDEILYANGLHDRIVLYFSEKGESNLNRLELSIFALCWQFDILYKGLCFSCWWPYLGPACKEFTRELCIPFFYLFSLKLAWILCWCQSDSA